MACTQNYALMKGIALSCDDKPTGGLVSLRLGILGDHAVTGTAETGFKTDFTKKTINIVFNKKDNATNFIEDTNATAGGSKIVTPTATVQLAGLNKATRDNINKLANPLVKVVLFAETVDGVVWMMGREFGMYLSSVEGGTGVAASDFNGYTLTFTGEEKDKSIPVTVPTP